MRDLKHIYYILGAAALTSCADDVVNGDATEYLNGKEKTPITVVTNLSASKGVTRAVDEEFEANDLLNAYIKHVKEVTPATTPVTYTDVTGTGVGPRLANFKVSALTTDHENEADNWTNHSATSTLQVTDAAGLYWDDFSNSASDDTDLRTSGHALMVYYGYGYNGEEGVSLTDEAAGTLNWTVATNQTSGFKTSDLLYAGQQTPVAYAHGTDNTITGRDRVLTIPYTHAMSKVTIEVICDEGFSTTTDNFANTTLALKSVNTACTVTGPTKALSAFGTSHDVTMQHVENTGSDKFLHQSYSALIAPTVIKAGETFATITNVDGNNYTISLADAALTTATTPANAWSTQLAAYNATSVTPDAAAAYTETNGGLTKPGVHYMLTVTIKKQQIKVEATIQDWKTVSATGIGVMDFSANIISSTSSGTAWEANGDQFNLWRSKTNADNAAYDENTSSTDVVDKATTLTYSTAEPAGWNANPKIYWPNNNTDYYFRALAKYNGEKYVGFEGENSEHTGTTDLTVYQGTDLVWGTTAEHTGTKEEGGTVQYAKGAAINPRTSQVPLEFEHAMSKISVILNGGEGVNAIDITGATISIVNIYDHGTVSLKDGSIIDLDASNVIPIKDFGDKNSSTTKKLDQFCVIPQSLVNDKDNNARTGATTFYTPNDLTKIYDDGSSLSTGGGTGATYVTSTLTPKNYTEDQAKEYNAKLDGAKKKDDVKEAQRDYTLAEYNVLDTKPHASIEQSAFDGMASEAKVKIASRLYTIDEYKALETLTDGQFEHLIVALRTKPTETYTAEEAVAYNATLPGAVKENDEKDGGGQYTADEAIVHNAGLQGAVKAGDNKPVSYYTLTEYNALPTKPHASISDEQFNNLDDLAKTKPAEYYSLEDFKALATLTEVQFNTLPPTLKRRAAILYTQAEADAYNATLSGAKSTNDVHHYVKNADSKTAEPGDIKSNGNKVVLHIMLADKTGYTLDLSTCKDTSTDLPVTAWEPGKDYTYTITLGKEEILFRALVKDWDKKETSGNATFEWD